MAGIRRFKIGESAEDYLKAIFKLGGDADSVSTNSLAIALDVSPAAATKAIQLLAEKRLADYTPYHGVSLTESGRKAALKVIRHHRLLELFLHDVLGFSWDEVDAEAERLEHHISEKFEARIDDLLGYPTLDPHGDPIPSQDGQVGPNRGKPLAECGENETVVILRVRDGNPEVLKYLDHLRLHLGVVVEVVEKQPFNGPLTLRVGDVTHTVGLELASHMFVEEYAAAER